MYIIIQLSFIIWNFDSSVQRHQTSCLREFGVLYIKLNVAVTTAGNVCV